MGACDKTAFASNDSAVRHMNAQRLHLLVQHLHRIKLAKIPVWTEKRLMKFNPLQSGCWPLMEEGESVFFGDMAPEKLSMLH